MGYRLVQAVLVVTLGRLGDMFGRVRIYNAGFAVFTVASILLSFDPFDGGHGALWLIGWRVLQARRRVDADRQLGRDPDRRLPGRSARFRAGHQPGRRPGRAVHRPGRGRRCSPPWTGGRCSGSTCPSASSARCGPTASCARPASGGGGRIDWWGNVTFAVGLSAVLIAVTYGIQPYGGHTMGWTNPRGRRPARRRSGAAGGLRRHRAPGRRADVPAQPVPHPGLHRRQRGRPRRRRSPAAGCSSC